MSSQVSKGFHRGFSTEQSGVYKKLLRAQFSDFGGSLAEGPCGFLTSWLGEVYAVHEDFRKRARHRAPAR